MRAFIIGRRGPGGASVRRCRSSIAIAGLLGVVAFSYRQVCIAYPTGGGSYSVSKANFGRHRLARGGVGPAHRLQPDRRRVDLVGGRADRVGASRRSRRSAVGIGVGALALITLANLRGVREAGNIFAVPTYLFMFSAFADDRHGGRTGSSCSASTQAPAAGGDRRGRGHDAGAVAHPPAAARVRVGRRRADRHRGDRDRRAGVQATGIEERGDDAAGDGRRSWRSCSSASRSSRRTSRSIRPCPSCSATGSTRPSSRRSPTVVFGADSLGFYLFQAFTALLLFLAANTSFAAFPRLAAVLGEDGFFPRQFALRGDRLAFSMGILLLGLIAASLVVIVGGRDPRAHPAVRGRRVHRLHDQPGRDDPPLAARARAGLALPAGRSTRSAASRRPSWRSS